MSSFHRRLEVNLIDLLLLLFSTEVQSSEMNYSFYLSFLEDNWIKIWTTFHTKFKVF